MSEYLVTWKIDIEADDAVNAAFQAKWIQQDPDSTAVHFTVTDKETGIAAEVYADE